MIENKDHLQHFLFNILTILNSYVADLGDSEDKETITNLIQAVVLIVAHEDFLLDRKTKIVAEEFQIGELLELLVDIYGKESVKVNYANKDQKIKIGKYYFWEALKQLVACLLRHNESIEIKYSDHQLHIAAKVPESAMNTEAELSKILKTSLALDMTFQCCVALTIFKKIAKGLEVKNDKVVIFL